MSGNGALGAMETEQLEELESHLQGELLGRVHDLRIRQRDNGLVLEGHAGTYYAKQLAQQTLMKLCDLPLLANEIEVS